LKIPVCAGVRIAIASNVYRSALIRKIYLVHVIKGQWLKNRKLIIMKNISHLTKLAAACLLASMAGTTLAETPEVTELIVRFKSTQTDFEYTNGAANTEQNSQFRMATKKALASSQNSRPLIHSQRKTNKTHSASTEARKKTSVANKSAREKLNEYVVIKYPNRQALEAAKAAFENDPNVIWVGENKLLGGSSAPSDPLYSEFQIVVGPTVIGDKDYQWGMKALNMSEVWDYTKGHAYIAAVDMGLEKAHPDLQLNFRDQFSYDYADDDDNVDELDPSPSGQVTQLGGHGTHVAGILAASSNNGVGVAGICWNCSLMMEKTGTVLMDINRVHSLNVASLAAIADSITGAVDTGAQVINMSLGGQIDDCSIDPNGVLCLALEYANEMDVVMAAAAGNESAEGVDFPARDPRVISVGAVDIDNISPIWASNGPEKDIVAPGVHILSTFYANLPYIGADVIFNNEFKPECSDEISGPPGYGPCSGTSMSTPHISGITALLRSVNPLLSNAQVKEILLKHASQADNPDDIYGHGMPDVLASVKDTLGTVGGHVLNNRLTPLFSMYSLAGEDSLYTTVPQMALSAMHESLKPQPPSATIRWISRGGSPIPGYSDFPRPWGDSDDYKPMASVFIFTTHRNPINPGSDLVPLYRLSYQGNFLGTNPLHVDHVYTTEQAGIDAYTGVGYVLDGIEGYIFPNYEPQPEGTVKLFRKYNPERDDHAIFPETELADMEAQGYDLSDGNDWIGYVYPNIDSDSDGLIDGFEAVIGTDMYKPDSDYDGITDGIEVNNYPYSDPMDTVTSPIFAVVTANEVNSKWYSFVLPTISNEAPVLLSQIQTFNGGDTASLRMQEINGQGGKIRVEEEQSRDTETAHTNEVVGLFGVMQGDIADSNGNVVGEAGFLNTKASGDADWKSLSFANTYTNPIVIMNIATINGGQPVHIRLDNVTPADVKYQIEEWDYLDQSHLPETIAYVVLEQGEYNLQNGKAIRVGTTSTNQNWTSVNFNNSYELTPVIFTQSQTYNDQQAVVTRQKEATPFGFSVRLQGEEAKPRHAAETIGYLAIEHD
jgi:serine protease